MNRIIFPLDGDTGESFKNILTWGDLLQDKIAFFKVGLKSYIANGPRILGWVSSTKVPIMLDLKLHDIPNTMREATQEVALLREIGFHRIRFLTVHAAAGYKALEACVEAADGSGLEITAVTQLTSVEYDETTFIRRVKRAKKAGVRTFVCSPNEASLIKSLVSDATIITPGIRLAGDKKDDQVRTNTPRVAVSNGADYLVVGRSIRNADNPAEVATQINKEAEIGYLTRIG